MIFGTDGINFVNKQMITSYTAYVPLLACFPEFIGDGNFKIIASKIQDNGGALCGILIFSYGYSLASAKSHLEHSHT